MILRANEAGHLPRLWLWERGAPAPRPLTREGMDPYPAVSPDGARFAGVDAEGALRVWSDRGDELAVVPGRFADSTAIQWTADGEAIFVRSRTLPARVSRVDLRTGVARPHLIIPSSPRAREPGLVSVMTLFITADGQSYAYTYNETLSRLYVVDGLARGRD